MLTYVRDPTIAWWPRALLLLMFHNATLPNRAQPDWAYEFLDRTGPDTQICRTGLAGQVLPDRTESGLTFLNILPTNTGYQFS